MRLGGALPLSSSEARRRLDSSYQEGRFFNYSQAFSSIAETFNQVNKELEDPLSKSYQYLVRCNRNPAYCPGYLTPQRPKYRNLYCDGEILRSAIYDALTYFTTIKTRCELLGSKVFLFLPYFDPNEWKQFARDCVTKDSKSRIPVYALSITWLRKQQDRMEKIVEKAVKSSPWSDGFAYLRNKAEEEMSLTLEMKREFDQRVAQARMHEILASCEGDRRMNERESLALEKLNQKGLDEYFSLGHSPYGLTFRTNQFFVIEKIHLTSEEQLLKQLEKEYSQNPPKTWAERELWEEKFRYFRHKAGLSRMMYDQEEKEERMSASEHIVLPELAKGLIPYQFKRMARGWLEIELQKKTYIQVREGQILENDGNYMDWAEETICQNTPWAKTSEFCNSEYERYRFEIYATHYQDIKELKIPLDYSTTGEGTFLDSGFVQQLEMDMNKVNEFCFEQYGRVKEREEKQDLELELEILLGLVQFTPKTSYLSANGKFRKAIFASDPKRLPFFSSRSNVQRCFEDGYVFGLSPTSRRYRDKIHYIGSSVSYSIKFSSPVKITAEVQGAILVKLPAACLLTPG